MMNVGQHTYCFVSNILLLNIRMCVFIRDDFINPVLFPRTVVFQFILLCYLNSKSDCFVNFIEQSTSPISIYMQLFYQLFLIGCHLAFEVLHFFLFH